MLDGIWQKLGYENTYIDAINGTTGEDAAGAGAGTGAGGSKSFYDLKLQLPGQDRWMQMVSPSKHSIQHNLHRVSLGFILARS